MNFKKKEGKSSQYLIQMLLIFILQCKHISLASSSIENFVLYVDSLIIYHYHLINIIIIFTISYKRTLFQKAGENPFDGLESSFGSFGLNKESDVPELPGQANQWLQLDSSPMSARARNSGQSQASQRLSSQSGVSPRVSHESSKSTQQKKLSYRDMEGVGLHLR